MKMGNAYIVLNIINHSGLVKPPECAIRIPSRRSVMIISDATAMVAPQGSIAKGYKTPTCWSGLFRRSAGLRK